MTRAPGLRRTDAVLNSHLQHAWHRAGVERLDPHLSIEREQRIFMLISRFDPTTQGKYLAWLSAWRRRWWVDHGLRTCCDMSELNDVMFNLGAFSKLLTQFEAVHQWVTPAQLKALCLFLGNWAASNADEGGLDEVVQLNSVQIMTVHAAKGLEWPVVFLPRVSSSNFPSSRRNHGPETFLSPREFDPTTYAGGDDGERRLWYVAITRATKFLNVSTLDRNRKRPSEYFKEVHHDIVRRDGSDPTAREKGPPRPPDDAVMLPTTFSDLTYWWRCPHEYQLRSLMGFGPGVGEQYGYGQQLHNILAEIHDQASKGVVMTSRQVEDLVEERFLLRYTQGPPLEVLKRAAQKALSRYVDMNRDALRSKWCGQATSAVSTRFAVHQMLGAVQPELEIITEDAFAAALVGEAIAGDLRPRVRIHDIGSNAVLARQAVANLRTRPDIACLSVFDGDCTEADVNGWIDSERAERALHPSFLILPGNGVAPEKWVLQQLQVDAYRDLLALEIGCSAQIAAGHVAAMTVDLDHHDCGHTLHMRTGISRDEARRLVIKAVARSHPELDLLRARVKEMLGA